MSAHDIRSAERPAPDRLLTEIADYVLEVRRRERRGSAHRALLPHGHARLRHSRARFPRVHEAARARRARRGACARRARARHALRARSGRGGVQHRRDDPLARLQRHVARGRVGPSVGQSRRDSRRRRLLEPPRRSPHDGRRADGDDPGARDPGRARAESQLQPRRPRSRLARAHREHGGRDAAPRRQPRRDRERRLERVARRRRAANVSARAEHGLAQELGGRRRDEPRRAACALRARRRDGLSVRAVREGLGLSGRAVQGPHDRARARLGLVRHGERAVQDLVPGRVPRADGRRSGAEAAPDRRAAHRGHRAHHDRDAGARRAHHRQDGPARESGRSRSLPAVHGRRAAAARPADGRGLRGRRRARSAHRRVAGEDDRHGERGVQPRLPRPAEARDRQRGAGVVRATARIPSAWPSTIPIGHRRRREEGIPQLVAKFERNLATLFGAKQRAAIAAACADQARFEALPVEDFMALWVPQQ